MSKGLQARAAKEFPATVVEELTTLEKKLGGRQQVVGLLALAPLTPDLKYVLGMLGDPKFHTQSLATICTLASVLPGTLLKHLGEAAMARGKVEAQQAIGNGMAAVAQDVMRRAAPYIEDCYACQGTGTFTPEPTKDVPNPGPGPCDTCKGSGKLRHTPDLDRQKLAIEMAQLLPKGGGIQIAQINTAGAGAAGTGTDLQSRLMMMTDYILYPDRPAGPPPEDPPLEGEVAE